jgi:adenylylsulfate kinase
MKSQPKSRKVSTGQLLYPASLRSEKEARLKQHALVIWMCGLSGAGKSTLANLLDKELIKLGLLSQVIDGDIVRGGLNKGLGFSQEDRLENLRRVAEVTKLFVDCGVITIVSFISPIHQTRLMAQEIIGKADFIEVYINAPIEICEKRDPKGLYKMVREGKIKNFTGFDSPFEPPMNPDLEINTSKLDIGESAGKLLEFILPLVKYKVV